MTNEKVLTIVNAMQEHQGIDIKSYFVGDTAGITDYFVLASGNSKPQVDALVAAVETALGRQGINLRNREGRADGGWVLLDYEDVIVHIFSSEMREFYNLDHTWNGVPTETF